ncbi:MAG: energy transducer TonB [Acetobacter papayae]|uniref:cell envelope integrity protein TolA n=1 Tax=Acetobacter papayae TaxID=1076592 RepID=UPI0039E9BDA6
MSGATRLPQDRLLPHQQAGGWLSFADWQQDQQRLIRREDSLRWTASFLATLAISATCLWWVLNRPHPVTPLPEQPPTAIAIDLAPEPAAIPAPATDKSPAPQPTQAPAVPTAYEPPKVMAPPSPAPNPPEPVARQQKPVKTSKKHKRPIPQDNMADASEQPATTSSAPPPSETQKTPIAAAAAAGGSSTQTTHDPQTWQSALLGQLEKFRRYPSQAMAEHQEGTPRVTFSMDRQGHVLSVILAQTSGYARLDQEALSLPARAQPLPPPPDEIMGNPVTLTVPIEFTLSRN